MSFLAYLIIYLGILPLIGLAPGAFVHIWSYTGPSNGQFGNREAPDATGSGIPRSPPGILQQSSGTDVRIDTELRTADRAARSKARSWTDAFFSSDAGFDMLWSSACVNARRL